MNAVKVTPQTVEMMEFYHGLRISLLVSVLAELGVADEVADEPLPIEEIAMRTGADADSLYRALRAVASKGIFAEVEPRVFGLTELAETLRSRDGSLRDLFRIQGQPFMLDAFAKIGHTVRTGEPAFDYAHGKDLYSYLTERPEMSQLFNTATFNGTHPMQREAIGAYDLSKVRRLVDIGGGHGHLLAALLSRYPRMRGVVFDQPHVVQGATAVLAAAGVADRAEIVGGDYRSSIPAGDAHVLSNIVHQMSDDEAVAVLRNIREAMDPDGQVILIGPVVPEGNEPHAGKSVDTIIMTMTRGRVRRADELAALLEKAGLRHSSTVAPLAPASVVVAVAA
ncbi:MAG TPA: methyltransferase [Amycolatopsis sp.]|uniref:methyltransferase n=1 Tax=Amycolatopsis sp. TaxID=37632 RepID=UPI002B493B82|nr:methyltransferase [Amycolatopsis sp.]HKS47186.1 methyltransferase [Amycolatopsis sp.]